MTRRYVILLHKGHGPDHLDLMIENGQVLSTWQIEGAAWPEESSAPIAARRIQDHRLAYLDYEGAVSGGRGEVSRVDAGHCEVLRQENDLWEAEFAGTIMRGKWRIAKTSSSKEWELQRISAAALE